MAGTCVGDAIEQQPTRQTTGDARALRFRVLVDRGLDDAYRLAGIVLGDRVEAQDAVHDAVIAAWRGFGSLRDHDAFDAWFRRIVVNSCRDRMRARGRRRLVDLGRELAEAEHPLEPDASSSAAVRDAVDRALEALDPDERLVVVLRYHADMTVPGISVAAGLPEGTVKSRLHRAMQRLRVAIEEAER